MSFKLVSRVFDLPDLSPVRKFVLVFLAQHATEDGKNIFATKKSIAAATGYSKERVGQILQQLEREGYISCKDGDIATISISLDDFGNIVSKNNTNLL